MNKSLSEAIRLHPAYSARFSNHLLGLLLEQAEDDQNISVSPARLQAVLVLLANWTTPRIKKAILEMVGDDVITLSEANLLSGKKLLQPKPEGWAKEYEDSVPQIELQTILWTDKQLPVEEASLKKVSNTFNVDHKSVDFKDQNLKPMIDQTINEATHGLIKELSLNITEDTIGIITDILYFKAKWLDYFDPEDTKEQLFHGTKGKQKVSMMKRKDFMDYRETQHCQMVKLPYKCITEEGDVEYSMRIYLPKSKHSIGEVLHERWDDEFCTYTENIEVKLSLPRFTVESNIDMKKVIEALGLSSIYESNDIIPDCCKELKIQQIVQQTKISVEEWGTEAAAVTSVGVELGCLPFEKPKPILMTVNRPFIFEIAEDTTNTILFSGIINNID